MQFSKNFPKIEFISCFSPEEINKAVSKTDIICTCTNSNEALFKGNLPKEGCHINAIGSFSPDMNEFDSELVKRSHILLDSESANNCGELKDFKDSKFILGLLGDALNKGFQRPETGCTIFKSVGTAIQDIETAQFVLQKAKKDNVGQILNL